ncbi:HlyD family efflux transporter periplasmic adaptor subunit [uncultured Limimaricola sp.]|uniref:efflux RND transporter periplasmic adaptor subunit n=1 Tax=uncultured Limimaricola sp. TaxID=2211667 RepID=UPI0030F54AA4
MARPIRLIVLFAIPALIVASLLWVAFRPLPVTAELVPVARGPMEVTLEVEGKARIREVWEVSAPIAGTARRSPVRVGDAVVAGETLVAVVEPIEPSLLDRRSRVEAEAATHEAEAAFTAAESRLQQALQELSYAKSRHDQARTLVERGAAPADRLEEAAQALKVAQAARDTALSTRIMAQSALDRTRAALIGPGDGTGDGSGCCVEIRAPATGVVLAIDQLSARPVAAGERLLDIGDPNDLEIVADLLSRDAVRLPEDALAHVARWGGASEPPAHLRRIEPSARTEVSALGIEEQRVEAIFDFTTPDAPPVGLGDGYALRLRIVLWRSPDELQVPIAALFREGRDWACFVVEEGRARRAVLEIGQRNDTAAQVLGGLKVGDVVIAHPGEKVAEGVAIRAAERE